MSGFLILLSYPKCVSINDFFATHTLTILATVWRTAYGFCKWIVRPNLCFLHHTVLVYCSLKYCIEKFRLKVKHGCESEITGHPCVSEVQRRFKSHSKFRWTDMRSMPTEIWNKGWHPHNAHWRSHTSQRPKALIRRFCNIADFYGD